MDRDNLYEIELRASVEHESAPLSWGISGTYPDRATALANLRLPQRSSWSFVRCSQAPAR